MEMKKENVKYNSTPATIFIGCGGIGSDIVSRIAGMCQGDEADRIRFVVLDTNTNDLKKVVKGAAQVTAIQTSSTQSILDYLKNDEDARRTWFPNNTTLYPKTVSEGAGQVRAISRLAMNTTIKIGHIQRLYREIDNLFLKDGGEFKQALRVVIVSSAAGGTGSGIAMMVGMMVRQYLRQHYREKSALIRGFLLLPGVMDSGTIRTQSERQSLRRNGYATIKEINAFMMNASGFCGVRKELNRFRDIHVDVPTADNDTESLNALPFDFCFLLDRVDNQQESMQTLEQYKAFAAQSLYEQNIGAMQSCSFSMEDNIIKEFANAENLGRNRFGGIGSSVLRYPYEEIADYVAYTRAMERIGGGGEASDWSKYDKKYKSEMDQFKKKRGLTAEKEPNRGAIYVAALNNDEQRFGQDIKRELAPMGNASTFATRQVTTLLSNITGEILSAFTSLPAISSKQSAVESYKKVIDYKNDGGASGTGAVKLGTLRAYETQVKKEAYAFAKAKAQAMFFDSPNIKGTSVKPYHIESVLTAPGGSIHPNAVRYMLYLAQQKMQEQQLAAKARVDEMNEKLKNYAPGASNPTQFDVDMRASKIEECTIDELVELERENPTFKDSMEGYDADKLYEKYNVVFPAYAKAVLSYREAVLSSAAFEVGLDYLHRLCQEFERFYGTFGVKITELKKKKEDIVDGMRFRRGQFVSNICGTERHLQAILAECPESSDGLLLPSDLNADILEAIKRNTRLRKEYDGDPRAADQTTDVFDEVLIDYFRGAVREDCAEIIDLNIIDAIRMECRLNTRFQAEDSVEKIEGEQLENITPTLARQEEYLADRIRYGHRLASPGITGPKFDEPREVCACAYSVTLKHLKGVDVKALFEVEGIHPEETDTVSKYEIRFFNALYNLTPDRLARFMNPESCNMKDFPGETSPGIYFSAYHNYIQDIGPDSTKSATISLHIDKRWDSVAELPELDMKVQYAEMVRIHMALIYGLIYDMIKTRPSSRHDAKKRIFELEDSEGELIPFVVSNGTECDEFYEVLDALYRDRAAVKLIHKTTRSRSRYDIEKNHRYNETAFYHDLNMFRIGDGHEDPTSLFEIPLAYYNSLPRVKMDDNELSIMIDSVIRILEEEVAKYEQPFDQMPYLVEILEEQFRLLVDNFSNEEYDKLYDIRKNTAIQDNAVIGMVLRKVSNKIKQSQVSDCDARARALRELVRGKR